MIDREAVSQAYTDPTHAFDAAYASGKFKAEQPWVSSLVSNSSNRVIAHSTTEA